MTIIQNLATQLSCYRPPIDSSNPTHASTSMQGGQAVFENDNYRITAGDNDTVTINNKHTGECYKVHGDPHVDIDGKHAFDFYGKTTFKLEDGTKITIDTVDAKNHPGQTLSSKVTITNGDYGVRISGVDSNTHGDLKINEAKGYGQLLDAVVSDGNTIQENPAGQGFLAVNKEGTIKAVDQNYINQTDLKKGGAALHDKHKEAFSQLRDLVSIALQGLLTKCQPHPWKLPRPCAPVNDIIARPQVPEPPRVPAPRLPIHPVGAAVPTPPTPVGAALPTPPNPVAVFGPTPPRPVAVFGPTLPLPAVAVFGPTPPPPPAVAVFGPTPPRPVLVFGPT